MNDKQLADEDLSSKRMLHFEMLWIANGLL